MGWDMMEGNAVERNGVGQDKFGWSGSRLGLD